MIRRAAAVVVLVVVSSTTSGTATAQVASTRDYPAEQRGATSIAVGGDRQDARRRGGGNVAVLLDSLDRRITRAGRQVAVHERTGRRMDRWFRCIHRVPVDQVGDVGHRWGFEYDEEDGTGLDTRPALVLHTGQRRPDLVLLRRSRDRGCLSRAPDPNGTGADARVVHGPPLVRAGAAPGRTRAALRRLERRVARLERRIDSVGSAFDRFDEWESCLSWLPVTELGHEDQDVGYLFDVRRAHAGPGPQARRVGAVDVDTSEWDDPDYELLAFLGRDRPFSHVECGHEPGEAVDRAAGRRDGRGDGQSVRDRLEDLRRDVRAAREDVEDLLEPVQEFVQFDECMYTVGLRSQGDATGGYRYVDSRGTLSHRSALSFDLRGLRLPEMDVMAFSGEEPPQIECNEDAGGADTDE